MKVRSFFLGLSLAWASTSVADVVTGQVYRMGSNQAEKLFDFKNQIEEKDGVRSAHAEFTSPDGQVVVVEKSRSIKATPERFEIDHKQLGKQGLIELKENEIHFSRTEHGKTKTATEKLEGNFVVPHTLVYFIRSKWAELESGREIDIRLGVWDRLETVGFTLKKTEESSIGERKAMVIRMKPTSFVIAAIVDPLYFHISTDTQDLLKMVGRVQPKTKKGDKWADLDAEVLYQVSK